MPAYSDHVRQLVDPTGQLLLAQSFDPFGNVLERGGAGSSVFGYTGEQIDPTDLVYLRARYYSPGMGRFLMPDTIVPDPLWSGGWNRYGYVGNNPVRFTDPSGHCPPSICRKADGTPIDDYYRYGDRGVMNSLPLTGLNPWYPVDVIPPPFVPSRRSLEDGYSVYISVDPVETPPVSGTGGFEILFNRNTGDITLFGIVGGKATVGASVSQRMMLNAIYNIGNNNLNYAGLFVSGSVTGACEVGLTGGAAYTPRQDGNITNYWLPDFGDPYSIGIGGAGGVGLSGSIGPVEYIPLVTLSRGDKVKYEAGWYLFESNKQWLIGQGIEKAIRLLGETAGFNPDEYDWNELR